VTAAPAGTLVEIATGAFRQLEHALAGERNVADERRDREREHDGIALTRALQSPLARWFPGVDWHLAERRLPGGAVVVRDPESGLLFRVSAADGPWRVDLVRAAPEAGPRQFAVELPDVTGPADVGRWLHDQALLVDGGVRV